MSDKSVVITGANGFVGRALCETLLSDGWKVKGLVRSVESEAFLPDNVESCIVADMDNVESLTAALEGYSNIVHLAAKVHDMVSSDIEAYRHVNTAGTKNLANAAVKAGVNKFIYISTIKVNGEKTHDNPFKYSDSADPQDPYSISKYEAECVLHDIEKESSLDVTIIRPPLVYGPMVKGNLSVLMKWIDKGVLLPLAKIKNSRSLLNIANFTDFIRCCLENSESAGKTFLLSDDHDVSTSELISDMAHSMDRPVRLFYMPRFMVYVLFLLLGKRSAFDRLFDSLTVNISYTKKTMGWKPQYSYRDGIQSMVSQFIQ